MTTPPTPAPNNAAKTLMVLRHAKAEAIAGTDHERDLTARGRQQAHDMGMWLAQQELMPDIAHVSSARRTQSTWDLVAQAANTQTPVWTSEALYSAGPEGVLAELRTTPAEAVSAVYVGHNPTAETMVPVLDDGTGDPAALAQTSQGFSTCTVAVFHFEGEWADLAPARARLVAVHST